MKKTAIFKNVSATGSPVICSHRVIGKEGEHVAFVWPTASTGRFVRPEESQYL